MFSPGSFLPSRQRRGRGISLCNQTWVRAEGAWITGGLSLGLEAPMWTLPEPVSCLCYPPRTPDSGSRRVKGPGVLFWDDRCLSPEVSGGDFTMLSEHMYLSIHKDVGP